MQMMVIIAAPPDLERLAATLRVIVAFLMECIQTFRVGCQLSPVLDSSYLAQSWFPDRMCAHGTLIVG